MSPIPTVATAFALSPATPSVSLAPDSAKSASVMSHHLLSTGGFLFAVVALVSVAGYFYHGRGAANRGRTNNTWMSFAGLLSSMRHRGPATTTASAATDWPIDLEVGFEQHVSMVYAKFFHPTFWNLVECHPATPSAPAICVEEESNENPVSEPQPPGRNSFLNMDDDDDDGDDDRRPTRKKPDRDERGVVKVLPPYDVTSATSVDFNSKIIGTTLRPSTFLLVPGQVEDDSSDDWCSDSDLDFGFSASDGMPTPDSEAPYDGIATTNSEAYFHSSPYDGIATSDCEAYFPCSPYGGIAPAGCEADFSCPPYDGIVTIDCVADSITSPYDGIVNTDCEANFTRSSYDRITASHSEPDFPCSPYDRIVTSDSEEEFSSLPYLSNTPRSSSSPRRYGMADMTSFAQHLKDTVPREGYPLVPTVSHRSGLVDLSQYAEIGPITSCVTLRRLQLADDETRISECDVNVHDDCDTLESNSIETNTASAPHEGLDLMRKLLGELRDPDLDCTPRSLSEDSDSEYSGDDDEASIPSVWRTPLVQNGGLSSLKSVPGLEAESDVSDETLILPLTPPPMPTTPLTTVPDVHKDRMSSPFVTNFEEDMRVASPTWVSHSAKQNSSTCVSEANSDVSDEGPIYPLTPPQNPTASLPSALDVYKEPISPFTTRFNEEMLVMSPMFSDSPLSFPIKAHIRSHRNGRSPLYGSRVPLVNLPPL